MIKRIKIENFRSFVKAEAVLQPFTLVIGTNGAGKSNFLRWFLQVGRWRTGFGYDPHLMHRGAPWACSVEFSNGQIFENGSISADEVLKSWEELRISLEDKGKGEDTGSGYLERFTLPEEFEDLPLFNIDPTIVSREEVIVPDPKVDSTGGGTAQVLDSLKNGNREDLFDRIEENFCCYVPEVEKLSLLSTGEGKKVIQVRERGLGGKTLPASELSEGTRLILCILTIIHQENPPPVILLEDIDRGMHPRLFERIAPLMRRIAEEHDINIVATTHNPYLVDAFQDAKECVLLVEKTDGSSVLVPLIDRLKEVNYDEVESDMPLGHLWYSGLIGGVPQSLEK